MTAAARCAGGRTRKEAASPPLISGARHAMLRGRSSGLQGAAHRAGARQPCGLPWTPETSAAPGVRKSGQARACPPPRAARGPRRGGRLRYPDAREQSEQAFDKTEEKENYTNPGLSPGPGNLITAEPPGEAASHRTRCARNPGCSSKPGCPSPPSPPPRRKVTPVPSKKAPRQPQTADPRFAPLPPQPMIRSRAAASRALRRRCAGASRPLTRPPARRNRQRSGQGSTLKRAPKRKTAHHRTHLRSRGDAGKRTASVTRMLNGRAFTQVSGYMVWNRSGIL